MTYELPPALPPDPCFQLSAMSDHLDMAFTSMQPLTFVCTRDPGLGIGTINPRALDAG